MPIWLSRDDSNISPQCPSIFLALGGVRGWLKVNFCFFFLWGTLAHPAKSRCRRSVCQENAHSSIPNLTQYLFCYYRTIRFAGISFRFAFAAFTAFARSPQSPFAAAFAAFAVSTSRVVILRCPRAPRAPRLNPGATRNAPRTSREQGPPFSYTAV